MNSKRQRGMALITVLLVMALAVLIVSGLLRSHEMVVASIGQQVRFLQQWQLAVTGENHARALLAAEHGLEPSTTHLAQPWAQLQRLQLDQGQVLIKIEDRASRFNLQALAARGQIDRVTLQRWQRLRDALAIQSLEAQDLQGMSLLEVEQLRALPGVDRALMQRLQPWVTLLPVSAGLNINTVSATVLSMLEGVDERDMDQLLRQRPEHGYASVQAFVDQANAQQLAITGHGLAVSSNWFDVTVQVQQDGQTLYLFSALEREPQTNRVRVVRRNISRLGADQAL